MPTALITGINGQDGSYLAEFLIQKDYTIVGWIPGHIDVTFENIEHILPQIKLVRGSLYDSEGLNNLIEEYQPDEIYNFASPSSPNASWDRVEEVSEAAGLGVARLLEAVRRFQPEAKFYQASSSELFGNPLEVPQNEKTPFHPRNPYGIAKLFSHWMAVNYRERYQMHVVSGILFNHESPRRGKQFVTRKISREAAQIKLGLSTELRLGNLDAHRDWGYAGDYIEAIYAMLHQSHPVDYVIGTGITHSVREFCEHAFAYLDLDYRDYVIIDEKFLRPEETRQLVADPRKANNELGWKPRTDFIQLVNLMVESDLKKLLHKING
jgi:GDPmannose 4,6-dehydratase